MNDEWLEAEQCNDCGEYFAAEEMLNDRAVCPDCCDN